MLEFAWKESLLRDLLNAHHVLVLTGAGMSVESGIPTFREAQTGLWARFTPEDLATPEAFAKHPERVWKWYEERRAQVRRAKPHAGHFALVQLENLVPGFSLVTQNVDGLHQAAGSQTVCELHGNILRSKCQVSHRPISAAWLADASDCPPRSPYVKNACARPDVVWFGETLPQDAIDQAMAAAARCDFCFSVGTTSVVQPAASLPLIALGRGARLVEINPLETPLSKHADQCFRGGAEQVLASLVAQAKSRVRKHDHHEDRGRI
ncbi:MAG: NAD-dependent deacylase [Xanthomonadales bacterium]|nr:NAD-dependent deacylase [Xanthomonadales bacterium]